MIGTTLNDRYRLEAEVGRGGTGAVYRAHDSTLDRDVAIKMVSGLDLRFRIWISAIQQRASYILTGLPGKLDGRLDRAARLAVELPSPAIPTR